MFPLLAIAKGIFLFCCNINSLTEWRGGFIGNFVSHRLVAQVKIIENNVRLSERKWKKNKRRRREEEEGEENKKRKSNSSNNKKTMHAILCML